MSTVDETTRVPSQERAIRTRASLVDAAKAEFSERGYASATAKSIAERAGVSTGSFYQYFRDKDQVLYELARARYERVASHLEARLVESESPELELELERESVAALLRERMRELVAVVIEFHREDPGLHAVLTERRHADEGLDRMTGDAESALVQRIVRMLRSIGRQGDVEALSFVLFGMVEGAVHAHVLGRPLVDDGRLVDALVESLVRLAVA